MWCVLVREKWRTTESLSEMAAFHQTVPYKLTLYETDLIALVQPKEKQDSSCPYQLVSVRYT